MKQTKVFRTSVCVWLLCGLPGVLCGTHWDGTWYNTNSPSATNNFTDTEPPPVSGVLDAVCDTSDGSNLTAHCKDEKGEPFYGQLNDSIRMFIATCDPIRGLHCRPMPGHNVSCPDFSIQFGCNLRTTTTTAPTTLAQANTGGGSNGNLNAVGGSNGSLTTGSGYIGNGISGNGTNGSGFNGSGTSGSGSNGSGTSGSGSNGSGTSDSGSNGSGTSGSGSYGNGASGSGSNGSGTSGSGSNGSVTSGSGFNGSGTSGTESNGSGTSVSGSNGNGTSGSESNGNGTSGSGSNGSGSQSNGSNGGGISGGGSSGSGASSGRTGIGCRDNAAFCTASSGFVMITALVLLMRF